MFLRVTPDNKILIVSMEPIKGDDVREVDSIPEATDIEGKICVQKYDEINKSVYNEYVAIPKAVELEVPKDEIALLKEENNLLKIALAETIEKQEADKLELQLMMAEILESMEV
jgi:hypothetical protein